jgi:hypothetical protein
MAERPDLPRPVMRGRAGFHADQTGWQLLQCFEETGASYFLLEHHLALGVDTVNLKDRLGEINPDCANIHGAASSSAGP